MTVHAFGTVAVDEPLEAMMIEHYAPGAHDVASCGVCHSDRHTAGAEWAGTLHPGVPGHTGVPGHKGIEFAPARRPLIGAIAETQERRAFCAAHDVIADIEMSRAAPVGEAHDREPCADVNDGLGINSATLGD